MGADLKVKVLRRLTPITSRAGLSWRRSPSTEAATRHPSSPPKDVFIQQNIGYLSAQLGDATGAALAVTRARALAAVGEELDPPTRALLNLYFRTIDAQVARLQDRPNESRTVLSKIEDAAAAYEVPENRPDLAAQLEPLQPEIDTVRKSLAP